MRSILKVWMIAQLVFSCYSLNAQQKVITELPRWMTHMSMGVVVPDGYMERYIDDPSFGAYFEVLYRIKQNQPVLIGLSTSRTTFQKQSIKYTDVVDGSSFEIKEKTASRFANVGLNIRFQPELNWPIQPYLQGQVGWNYLYSNTIFKDLDANETFEVINEERGSRIGYGLQAGIQIIPNYWYARGDIRISYLRNPSVDILALDDNSLNSVPIENFVQQNTPISLLFIHIGGSYLF